MEETVTNPTIVDKITDTVQQPAFYIGAVAGVAAAYFIFKPATV